MDAENKMGVMPVGRLVITMGVPMTLSMLVGAFYNVVDSLFVSHYSETALSTVSLAFPVQNIIIASATGISVGINALLSSYLGQGKRKEAAESSIFLPPLAR